MQAENEHTGEHYNLYSLAGQILKFDYGATQIIVSVCGIIHPEYNSSIPCSGPGYAACHIRDNTVIRIMGMQGQAPEVTSDGAIRIVYPGKSLIGYFFSQSLTFTIYCNVELPDGDPCPFGSKGPNRRYKTYLDLYCDKNLIANEINETGCDLKIKYATPAACPPMVLGSLQFFSSTKFFIEIYDLVIESWHLFSSHCYFLSKFTLACSDMQLLIQSPPMLVLYHRISVLPVVHIINPL